MFTVEFAWFCLDLPDHATVEAFTSPPNPLFPESPVTTRWLLGLERYEITAHLSATRDLTELTRMAADQSGLQAEPFNRGGIPGMRYGAYERDRTQIDWWFYLHGLTLSLSLTAKTFPKTLPTEAERTEHRAIIDSVRRVGATH
ncbi:MAG: hypothetical protein AAF317_20435 [Pseudomonadota bacterium]